LRPVERAIEEIVSQLPGYEVRPQQMAMARTISRAIQEKRHALIEAGTGSGKSFGYLVPIIESGKKAVIATGTIALQEQLLHKDIPFLAQAYGREIKAALAKGRSNYICLRKLDEAHQTVPPGDSERQQVEELIRLSHGNWQGDRAELEFNVDFRLWYDLLASDPEDCLGPRCPNFMHTPHRIARQACEQAQIIVANHALYMADLAMGGGLLPQHDVVVFDEAHHLDRAAVSALTLQVSRWMANKLLQRAGRRFRDLPPRLIEAVTEAEDQVRDLLFERPKGQYRFEPEPRFEERAMEMSAALTALAKWLATVDAGQMTLYQREPEVAKERAEVLRDQMRSVAEVQAQRWEHFATLGRDPERANWMVIDSRKDFYELNSAPLQVADSLDRLLWSKKTCILTSATLAVDERFDFIKGELGLPAETLDAVLGSPFDFPNQALLYVPTRLPAPNDARFSAAAAEEIDRILRMTEGRAFVLCTSYRSLRELSAALIPRLPYPCKTQEDLPRARLVEWFKSTPNAVLFATATFWEGVDIPGDALSCVIIDKLPFSSPDEPVVQARTDRMKARGEDWFGGFVLPRAVLLLKQGFGRLIRTKTDRGIVAILDRRIATMRYGETVLRSLPPARRLPALAESLEAALARTRRPAAARMRAGEPYEPQGYDMGGFNAPPPDLDAVLGPPSDYGIP
jgi:ATP-dependent DNA helicase DinG